MEQNKTGLVCKEVGDNGHEAWKAGSQDVSESAKSAF